MIPSILGQYLYPRHVGMANVCIGSKREYCIKDSDVSTNSSSLCQTALFETQKKQREHPDRVSRKQMILFWSVLGFVTLWQFLPEYVFPMLGSMAFLCWVAPENATANFIGAGFGGMGFLNFSFDVRPLSPPYMII
jgi:hypothetical protein